MASCANFKAAQANLRDLVRARTSPDIGVTCPLEPAFLSADRRRARRCPTCPRTMVTRGRLRASLRTHVSLLDRTVGRLARKKELRRRFAPVPQKR